MKGAARPTRISRCHIHLLYRRQTVALHSLRARLPTTRLAIVPILRETCKTRASVSYEPGFRSTCTLVLPDRTLPVRTRKHFALDWICSAEGGAQTMATVRTTPPRTDTHHSGRSRPTGPGRVPVPLRWGIWLGSDEFWQRTRDPSDYIVSVDELV